MIFVMFKDEKNQPKEVTPLFLSRKMYGLRISCLAQKI